MKDTADDTDAGSDPEQTVRLPAQPGDDLAEALAALRVGGERRLERGHVVATGGMGVVSAVEDPLLQRMQAQKTLSALIAAEPSMQAALLREARLMGALEHPSIVPVHAVALSAQGQLCFTMKLVEGESLAQRLGANPASPLRDRDDLLDLVDVVVKVCDALAYAHARGVVHCDIKAANVMVGEHGQVYLMDWGVARVLGELAATHQQPFQGRTSESAETVAAVSGSPAHASPEQARGESWRIDPRTDVFLVGAMLYEILTRRVVNHAASPAEALARASRGEITSPSRMVPDERIPAELERITLKALAFEPDDRYQKVTALRDHLLRFARGGIEFPRRTYAAGEVIVRQGEPGDAAYLIVQGHCEVSMVEGGGEKVLRTVGPGDPFGEMTLLSPGPRTATVTALEPTTVEVVDSARFDEAVNAMPAWMRRFVLTLAERFREREAAGTSTQGGTG